MDVFRLGTPCEIAHIVTDEESRLAAVSDAISQATLHVTVANGRETTKGCLARAAGAPISNKPTSYQCCICSSHQTQGAVITGRLGGIGVDIMLDSGSSVSLIRNELLQKLDSIVQIPPETFPLQLVTASGEELPLDHVRMPIHLGELKLMHTFVVVNNLVSPVVLGVDFLQANALVLDFTKTPVEVTQACEGVGQQSPADMPPPRC